MICPYCNRVMLIVESWDGPACCGASVKIEAHCVTCHPTQQAGPGTPIEAGSFPRPRTNAYSSLRGHWTHHETQNDEIDQNKNTDRY